MRLRYWAAVVTLGLISGPLAPTRAVPSSVSVAVAAQATAGAVPDAPAAAPLTTAGGASDRLTRAATSRPATSTATRSQPRFTPRIGAEVVGTNAQYLFAAPRPVRQAQARAMAAAGVRIARSEANWQAIEPDAPSRGTHLWRWEATDQWVADLAAGHVRWAPILAYSTLWSSRGPVLGPDSQLYPPVPADYAAYAAAVAARYGAGGAFWNGHPELPQLPVRTYEVWNEPNTDGFWRPRPDPAAYAELFLAARAAVLASDRAATVIVGGLGSGPTGRNLISAADFLLQMHAARPEIASVLSAVGVHAYGGSGTDTVDRATASVVSARRALASLGRPDATLYVNEFGWSTGGRDEAGTAPLSEPDRARAIRLLVDRLARSNCLVAQLLVHTWVSDESAPTGPFAPGSNERWYGIYNADGSPKPSGAALGEVIRLLRGDADRPPDAGTVAVC